MNASNITHCEIREGGIQLWFCYIPYGSCHRPLEKTRVGTTGGWQLPRFPSAPRFASVGALKQTDTTVRWHLTGLELRSGRAHKAFGKGVAG